MKSEKSSDQLQCIQNFRCSYTLALRGMLLCSKKVQIIKRVRKISGAKFRSATASESEKSVGYYMFVNTPLMPVLILEKGDRVSRVDF